MFAVHPTYSQRAAVDPRRSHRPRLRGRRGGRDRLERRRPPGSRPLRFPHAHICKVCRRGNVVAVPVSPHRAHGQPHALLRFHRLRATPQSLAVQTTLVLDCGDRRRRSLYAHHLRIHHITFAARSSHRSGAADARRRRHCIGRVSRVRGLVETWPQEGILD